MARLGDPTLLVRWSPGEWAVVDGVAERCGVATGWLVREAALRAVVDVGRLVERGELVGRGRAGSGRSRASRASNGGSPGVPSPARRRLSPPSVASSSGSVDPAVLRAAAFRGAG